MSHQRLNDIFVNFQLRCHFMLNLVVSNQRFDQIQTRFHSLAFFWRFSDQIYRQFSAIEICRVFAKVVGNQKSGNESQKAIRAGFLVILQELFSQTNRVFKQVVVSYVRFRSLMR